MGWQMQPDNVSSSIGRYQILQRLGSGGMAEVFLAREPLPGGLSKILVVKKIHDSLAGRPAFQRMFEEEAKIAVNLNHPCVVQTFSYGKHGEMLYLIMEHVDGIDLLQVMRLATALERPVPPGLAAFLVAEVCKGLDYVHRRHDEHGEPFSIVHRDVSPQNVLVSWDGAVKLADFGIAHASDTDPGGLTGKYAYMSPEQALGRPLDRRSDIFSAGVVLWELVTAQPLFGALPPQDAQDAVRTGQVTSPRELAPDLPLDLEAIVMRALQIRPVDRFQTARDMQNALYRFFFAYSAARDEVVDSGRLAAYLAQLVSPAERRAAALLRLQQVGLLTAEDERSVEEEATHVFTASVVDPLFFSRPPRKS